MAANKKTGPRLHGRHAQGILRPHVWLVGPDPYKHSMYLPWLKSKAQAKYRDEVWELTFDDYYELWNGNWEYRGRDGEELCMTRIDCEGDWAKNNVEIITNKEKCRRHGINRRGTKHRTRGMDIQQRTRRTK